MAKKKKGSRRYNPNAPGNGKKLGATMKKQGPLRGPGVFLAKQTGLKGFKTVVPLFLLLGITAAVSPTIGARIVGPLASFPIVGDFAMLAAQSGIMLRGSMGGR
ncbi:MAG TPA: hypothetical protein EYN66_12790 [Myxococcales bacterium]|nr:hypothetical protein [Myxococcales bacterium]